MGNEMDTIHLKEEHLARYEKAKKKAVRFMLFDIDHNITDGQNQVPEYITHEIANLLNVKGVGIGFVSGRPEKALVPTGKDIISVVDVILPLIDANQLEKVIIFPEYAGYGVNIGSKKLTDYGFIDTFGKHKSALIKYLDDERYPWVDFIEDKRTGISLWIKPHLRDLSLIIQYIQDMNSVLEILGLSKEYIVIDGAHRTIDVLHKKVNKVRAIQEVANIYGILPEEIATSDDQADSNEGGYLFTNHPLGFATDSYYKESSAQISTKLAFNETGIHANMKLLKELVFQRL
ncbi:HAD family hydrolase [Paenibacillus caui]|uniref:HAD family hydrolase n=1 Tax=Paenibacillus caui TaxID=2873927 RepID=UPI001CA96025|nr:HAD family hydrolase [Paenibacillus caui]